VRIELNAEAHSAQKRRFDMKAWRWPICLATLFIACNSHRLGSPAISPEREAEIRREVREFAATVARDVTQDGPSSWRKHFSEGPEFFMASEGHLQFPNSAAAIAGIQELTRTIKHLELQFSDVRVDPLTPELAVMGASWHEVAELAEGKRVEDGGYFTGIVEQRKGQWQFRDAHWSVPPAAAPAIP
jgi:hypothetical protein